MASLLTSKLDREIRAKSRAAFVVVACVSMLWPATTANAHAVVIETSPTADQVLSDGPNRVTATFNEPVEVAFGALRVYDTDARRVDTGTADHPQGDVQSVTVGLEPGLPDGTYTATFRVISADAHPVQGAFVFHVGRPGEKAEGIGEALLSGDGGSGALEQVLYGVVRWVLFTGLITLIGAFFFVVLVWTRSRLENDDVDVRFAARWHKLLVWAWWAMLLSTIAGFVLQGAVAADESVVGALAPSVAGELLGTRYGVVAGARLTLLVLLGGAWVIGTRSHRGQALWPVQRGSTVGAMADPPKNQRWMALGGALIMVVLAATPGLSGHAGTTEPIWLNVPADALHVVAASIWLGGLIVLIAGAYRVSAQMDLSDRVQVLGPVIARFSDIAMVAVGVLVATGVYRTWVEVRALRAFVEAPYGWVLLAKIAVFLPLLAMGAVNNRVLKPRIERAMKSAANDDAPARTLRRLVMGEVALGIVVLALTALLVNLAPAKVEAGVSGPFVDDVALGADNLNIIVDPNKVGENFVHLTLTTSDGLPSRVNAMNVSFEMPSEDIGPLAGKGRKLGPGHYVVQGRQLSIPGEWHLKIVATYDRFTDEQVEVVVEVNR